MALFQLDPESIAQRVLDSKVPMHPPGLGESILRGVLGFAVVGVVGFMPWAICITWIKGATETQMHVACALAFILVSGLCLHRLIIGPGSLSRFYKLFALTFAMYAGAWMGMWEIQPDDIGALLGLLAGTVMMGCVFAYAFDAGWAVVKIIAALFAMNAFGYYAGRWCEGQLAIDYRITGIVLWGVCYGVGFGAGLGLALYFCQERARSIIKAARA